jgi:DNA-binding GntR family transcriptional regulator
MKPITARPTRTEQVYQAILDEICEGALAPGTHLVQENLAMKLGVSRQPVQQAMAMLKNDGLVQELGARGLYVAPLDLAMMRRHYEIRAVLDGLAARLAAGRAAVSTSDAAEIRRRGAAIIEAGHAAVAAGAVKRMVRRDVEFHGLIYEWSGNPLLAGTAEPHWRYLRRVMGEVMRHADRPEVIWRQHERILDAIVRGDAAVAEARAVEHVERAAGMLARALEDNLPAQARKGR